MTNDPTDYSTRDEVIVSGPSADELAAEARKAEAAMRASDGKVRYAILEACVNANIADDLAINIAYPGVDYFYVDGLGEVQSSGTYKSINEYVMLRVAEHKALSNPAMQPYLTPAVKERSFEVGRAESVAEARTRLEYYAKTGDQRNYRKTRAELAAM